MLPVLYTPIHREHEPSFFFVTGRFTPAQERIDRAEQLRDAAVQAGCRVVALGGEGGVMGSLPVMCGGEAGGILARSPVRYG